SDLAQVKDLARRQREYARRIVLSAANAVRTAETERDRVTRSEREARDSLASAGEQRERCLADLSAAAARSADLVAEIETLRSLDAYREGAQLEQLQRERERLARALRSEESSADARRPGGRRRARHAGGTGSVADPGGGGGCRCGGGLPLGGAGVGRELRAAGARPSLGGAPGAARRSAGRRCRHRPRVVHSARRA